MQTRDLIARLIKNLEPVERGIVTKRIHRAIVLGLALDTGVLVTFYGVSGDIRTFVTMPVFWIRLAFPLAILAAAIALTERLARPGARIKLAWVSALLPVIVIWVAAALTLYASPREDRLPLMLGTTWHDSTMHIVLLSLPSLALIMRTMQGLAPTRLVLAGAGAGLLAGAQGLLVYTLYGAEMAVPFWGIWYVLAIAVTTSIGAAFGPWLLRW
jgi:hypothetical protein